MENDLARHLIENKCNSFGICHNEATNCKKLGSVSAFRCCTWNRLEYDIFYLRVEQKH